MFRMQYNLPPNDSRYLDMTDEEILYDLILQNEYSKWSRSKTDDKSDEHREIFESDQKQFDNITKQLESGQDIDLNSLLPKDTWEKI